MRLALFFLLAAALYIPPAFGQGPTGDPALDKVDEYFVGGLWKQWTPEVRTRGAERYFTTPGLADRLAEQMAKLAAECIYRGPLEDLQRDFLREQRHYRGLEAANSPEAAEALGKLQRFRDRLITEEHKRGEASKAMMKLRRLIDGLAYMRHARAVAFIGPMLAIDGFVDNQGDASIYPPEQTAADALFLLATSKFIDGPADPSTSTLAAWRKWWAENRERYGPIPEALRAIDAGGLAAPKEGAVARAPAATPTPATPVVTPHARSSPLPAPAPSTPAVSGTPISSGILLGVVAAALLIIGWAVSRRRQ